MQGLKRLYLIALSANGANLAARSREVLSPTLSLIYRMDVIPILQQLDSLIFA